MAGAEIGRLSIRVMPDLKGFAKELKAKLKAIQEDSKLKIDVEIDTAGMAEKVKAEAARISHSTKITIDAVVDNKTLRNEIAKEVAGTNVPSIEVPVKLDPKEVFNESKRIGARIRESIGKPPVIKPKIDSDAVWKESLAIGKRASKLFSKGFTIKPDVVRRGRGGFLGGVLRESGRVASGIAGLFQKMFSGLSENASKFGDSVTSSIQGTMGKISKSVQSLGPYVMAALYATLIATLPAIVGGITIAIGGLEAALLALPGAIAGAGAAMGTLALAVQGIGDAIGAGWSGDLAKFNKSLKNLAPSAQTFARAIVSLKKPLTDIQKSVQQKFFAPFAGQIKGLAKQWIPLLKTGLGSVATSMGNLTSELGKGLASPEVQSRMKQTFDSIAKGFQNLKPAIKPLVDALSTLADTGLEDFFLPLSKYISQAAKAFDGWVQSADKSGDLQAMFKNLLDLIKAIGKPLGQLASGIAKAFASKDTSKSIKQLGDALSSIVKTILPYLPKFIEDFGNWATAIADFVHAFRFVFTAFDKFSDYLSWYYGTALPGVLHFFTEIIPEAAKAVGGFFKNIGLWIGGAAKAVANFFTKTIPGFFSNFGKSVAKWASGMWNSIKKALSPKNIPNPLSGLIKNVKAGLNVLGSWIGKKWTSIKSLASRAWNGVKSVISNAWKGILTLVRGGVKSLITAITGISRIVSKVRGFFNGLRRAASGGVGSLLSYVRGIPRRVLNALGSLGGLLWSAGRSLINGLIRGVQSAIGSLQSVLGGVTDLIPSWKGPPERDKNLLYNNGQLIMGGLIRGIEDTVPQLRSSLSSITGQVGGMALNSSVQAELVGSYQQTITVPLYVDSQKIAVAVAKGEKKNARRG